MSKAIEEKVVKLSLNNDSFKNKVKESIGSFNQLNKGLSTPTSTIAVDSIATSLASLTRRFSTMGIITASMLNNLVTSAMQAGRKIMSAVVDPMIEGGKKRALNIEQAKFQFEGLGIDVEAAMKSANDAVKGTAFGLDEAAVVASQFGASGMEAGEEMTSSLRGIAGVAAMTGSSFEDIGRIFTSVSGNGRLMGDDLLQLSGRGINAASTLGKAMNKTEGEIREMVTKGEIDFKTFSDAMDQAFGAHATKANELYTGSLSNLKAALGRIGADFAAPNFTNKRDIFNALTPKVDELHKALNGVTEAWNKFERMGVDKLINTINGLDFKKFTDLGGVDNLTKAFSNSLTTITKLLGTMRDGFRKVFPPATTEGIVRITESIKNLSEKLLISDKTAAKLTTVFQGIASIFHILFTIVGRVASGFAKLIPGGLFGTLLDLLVKLAELIIKLDDTVTHSKKVKIAFISIGDAFKKVSSFLVAGAGILGKVASGFLKIGTVAKTYLLPVLKKIGEAFKESFKGVNAGDLINGGMLAAVLLFLRKIAGLSERFNEFLQSFKGVFTGISGGVKQLGGLTKALQSMEKAINVGSILVIAGSVLTLAAAMRLIANIKASDLSKSLVALSTSLYGIMTALSVISKSNLTGSFRAVITIQSLAGALLVMSAALKVLSTINPGKMITALLGLAGSMVVLVTAMNVLSKINGATLKNSVSIGVLAASMIVLAGAVYILGSIDTGKVIQGIIAMGAMLLELSAFLALTSKSKLGVGTATALGITSGAIMLMCGSIYILGSMDVPKLIQGFVAISAILGAFALFSNYIGSGAKMLLAATAIGIISAALLVLAVPLKIFASMSLEEIGKSLLTLAGSLAILVGALYLAQGSIGGSMALIVAAGAIAILAPALKLLSTIPILGIVTSLAALAGVLVILGATAYILGPFSAALIPIAAGIAAIGVAAAGIGLVLTGVGLAINAVVGALTALGKMTIDTVATIVRNLAELIEGLMSLIPRVVEFGVKVILGILKGIQQTFPELMRTFIVIISSLLDAAITVIPKFVDTGLQIMTGIMQGISDNAEALMTTAVEMVISVVEGIAVAIEENQFKFVNAVKKVYGAVLELLVTCLEEIVVTMFGWIPGLESVANKAGDAARKGIHDKFNADTSKEDADEATGSFTKNVDGASGEAERVGENVGSASKKGMGKPEASPEGKKIGKTYIGGVKDMVDEARNKGEGLGEAAKGGAGSVSANGVGADFGEGMALGIESKTDRVRGAATQLGSISLFSVASAIQSKSPSKKAMLKGKDFGEGYALGIENKKTRVTTAAKDVALSSIEGTKAVINTQLEQLKNMIDLEPVIKPILDLSNIKDFSFNGTGNINDYYSRSSELPGVSSVNNTYNVDNKGMLDGAVFHIREEADLNKIVKAVDNAQKLKILRLGGKVVTR